MKQILLFFGIFIFLFASIPDSCAQQIKVSGKILSNGQSLPNVQVRAGKIKLLADSSGNFGLTAAIGTVLIVEKSGFTTEEIVIKSQDSLIVELYPERVIVPYGTVEKSLFSGSAVALQSEYWSDRGLTNVLNALHGSGTGIQTALPTGEPGADPELRIAGMSLLYSNSKPLYIVDGAEFGASFVDINPVDIESITVLKDAVSMSMYGSRGQNGVVIITTKRGKKKALDFRAEFGLNSNAVPQYNTLNVRDYYETFWQIYRNTLTDAYKIPAEIAAQIASGTLPRNASGLQMYENVGFADVLRLLGNYNAFNVPGSELFNLEGKLNPDAVLWQSDMDWMGKIARKGVRNNYTLAYSTSSRRMDIYTSINYLREEGWRVKSALERYSGRVNINYSPFKWFKAGINASVLVRDKTQKAFLRNGNDNALHFTRTIGPIYPVFLIDPATGELVYDSHGNKIYDTGGFDGDFKLFRPFSRNNHPVLEDKSSSGNSVGKYYSVRAKLEFRILPSLNLAINGGQETIKTEGKGSQSEVMYAYNDYFEIYTEEYKNHTLNQVLCFSKKNGHNDLSVMAGHENYWYDRAFSFLGEIKHSTSELNYVKTISNQFSKNDLDSYFFRLNYRLRDKYGVEWAGRNDKILKEFRSKSWSAGVSWNLNKENFANFKNIDDLVIKANYGRTKENTPALIFDPRNVFMDRLSAGGSFSGFNRQLSGYAEYFTSKVDRYYFTTIFWGEDLSKRRIVERNSGFEISFTAKPIYKEKFSWVVTANMTAPVNRILKTPEKTFVIPDNNYFGLKAGVSRYEYFTRTFYGINQANGEVLFKGVERYDSADPTTFIIGKDTLTTSYTKAKRSFVGKSALSKGYGSLINTFEYKRFTLGIICTYQFGGWIVDNQFMASNDYGINLHSDLLNAWKNPGDVTDIPKINLISLPEFREVSTRWLRKSDYINLSSINLSYSISGKSIPFLKESRVYFNAENLYFLSHRKGMNPLSNLEYNADSFTYNFSRTLTIGVNLLF